MNKHQRIATIIALALFASIVVYHYAGPEMLVRSGQRQVWDRPPVGLALLAVAVCYAGAFALLKRDEP